MKSIVADFVFGQERIKYEISQSKCGTGNYEVYLNQAFQCILYFQGGHSRSFPDPANNLTTTEMNIIGDMIFAQLASEGAAIVLTDQDINPNVSESILSRTLRTFLTTVKQSKNRLKKVIQYHL